jgi:hypothetical protein
LDLGGAAVHRCDTPQPKQKMAHGPVEALRHRVFAPEGHTKIASASALGK